MCLWLFTLGTKRVIVLGKHKSQFDFPGSPGEQALMGFEGKFIINLILGWIQFTGWIQLSNESDQRDGA